MKIDKMILKFIWKPKEPKIVKVIQRKDKFVESCFHISKQSNNNEDIVVQTKGRAWRSEMKLRVKPLSCIVIN